MLFHFDRRKKSEKEKKPPRFSGAPAQMADAGRGGAGRRGDLCRRQLSRRRQRVGRHAPTADLLCPARPEGVLHLVRRGVGGGQHTEDPRRAQGVWCHLYLFVGNWADQYPEQAKAIVDSGNELMNHSNAHDHQHSLTADQIIADVNTCNDKIEALTGVRPTLIRCPFGEYDDHVISTIRSIGMEPIQWDVEVLAAVGTARGASDARPLLVFLFRPVPFRRAQQKAHHVERVARAVEIECREPYDRRQGSKPQRGGRGASCSSARAWEESGWGYKRCEWG